MEKFVNVEDPMHHSFLQKGQELKKELENLLGEFPIIVLNTKLKLHNVNLTRLITHQHNHLIFYNRNGWSTYLSFTPHACTVSWATSFAPIQSRIHCDIQRSWKSSYPGDIFQNTCTHGYILNRIVIYDENRC